MLTPLARSCLGAALIVGMSSGVFADERLLVRDGPIEAYIAKSNWCSPTVAITVRSSDPGTFAGNKVGLQKLIGALRAILGLECPDAKLVRLTGEVQGRRVYEGTANIASGGKLVDISPEAWSAEGAPPSPRRESVERSPIVPIPQASLRQADRSPPQKRPQASAGAAATDRSAGPTTSRVAHGQPTPRIPSPAVGASRPNRLDPQEAGTVTGPNAMAWVGLGATAILVMVAAFYFLWRRPATVTAVEARTSAQASSPAAMRPGVVSGGQGTSVIAENKKADAAPVSTDSSPADTTQKTEGAWKRHFARATGGPSQMEPPNSESAKRGEVPNSGNAVSAFPRAGSLARNTAAGDLVTSRAQASSSEVGQDAQTWVESARRKLEAGLLGDAEYEFRRAVAIEPENAYLRACVGAVREQANDFEGALASYRTAADLDPDEIAYRGSIGSALIKLQRFEEGIAELQRCLAQDPNNEEFKSHLAAAYLSGGHNGFSYIPSGQDMPEGWYPTTKDQITRAEKNLEVARALHSNDPDILKGIEEAQDVLKTSTMRRSLLGWRDFLPTAIMIGVGLFALQDIGSARTASYRAFMIFMSIYCIGGVLFYIYAMRVPQYMVNRAIIEGLKEGLGDKALAALGKVAMRTSPLGAIVGMSMFALLPIVAIYRYYQNYLKA